MRRSCLLISAVSAALVSVDAPSASQRVASAVWNTMVPPTRHRLRSVRRSASYPVLYGVLEGTIRYDKAR
jgi:hypothetical protein